MTCLGDCVVVDRVEVVEKSGYAFGAIAYGHVEVAHENREERVHVGFQIEQIVLLGIVFVPRFVDDSRKICA